MSSRTTTQEGPVLRARELGRRYGRRWALSGCTLDVPAGRVAGLVGPNGAGKSTLLNLAAGLLRPSTGTIEVCGGPPGTGPERLASIGYVAQNTPVYARLSVADHLRLGARLNPRWDARSARERVRRLGLPLDARAGTLSGGQRAQLALTLALAKRPGVLILDEPVASLDPLARREFLRELGEATAEHGLSVVHSSHLVSDVERVCDHLIVLVGSRVRLAGDVSALLAEHRLLTATRIDPAALPAGAEVVATRVTGSETTMVVRAGGPVEHPAWTTRPVGLEDLVLAYLGDGTEAHR
jgi:ABC-2 type transport system ATP-binding protein